MRSIYLLDRNGPKVGEATTDFLPTDSDRTLPALRCEACGAPVGLRRWKSPLHAEIETWGSRFGDLAFGPGEEFLVSERFVSLWRHDRLTGLHGFEPVEIVKVRHRGKRFRELPPKYFSVWAGRSDVAIDQVRSGMQWVSPATPLCEVCREGGIKKGWRRIVLEREPKENVFVARGLGSVLADQRFKDFCEEHSLKNCPLVPAEEASHWF